MKSFKTLEFIASLMAFLVVVTIIFRWTNLLPQITADELQAVGGIAFAIFALIAGWLKWEYHRLYKEAYIAKDIAEKQITYANIENRASSKVIADRDKEVDELNDMITDIRGAKLLVEEEARAYQKRNKELLRERDNDVTSFRFRFENLARILFGKSGKICAVIEIDGKLVPYFTFEHKKENGLIVSKRNGNKTEKLPAELGLFSNGVLFTKKDFEDHLGDSKVEEYKSL